MEILDPNDLELVLEEKQRVEEKIVLVRGYFMKSYTLITFGTPDESFIGYDKFLRHYIKLGYEVRERK